MINFITHGNFIIKLDEIKYAVFDENDKQIILTTIKEGKEQEFTMKYDSEYSAKEAFMKLTIDVDAWELDYSWKHPLVKQVIFLRNNMRNLADEMKKIHKEFALTRKQLKLKNV